MLNTNYGVRYNVFKPTDRSDTHWHSLPARYGLAAIYASAGREKEARDEVDEVYRIRYEVR